MVSKFIKCIGQELNKRWASIDRHIADTGFQSRVSSSLIWIKTQTDCCPQYKRGCIELPEVFSMEFDCHKNIDMFFYISGGYYPFIH